MYPQPIEAVAGAVEGVRPGRVVAIDLPEAETRGGRLVVLFEPEDEERAQVSRSEIRRRLAAHVNCPIEDVVPVPRQWLRRTTAGSVARDVNRERYLAVRRATKGDPFPGAEAALHTIAPSAGGQLRMFPQAAGDGETPSEAAGADANAATVAGPSQLQPA